MGETSSPVSAAVSNAGSGWPLRSSRPAAADPATATRAAMTIQAGLAPVTLPVSLVIMPSSDWLPAQPVKPVRPPWTNSPSNHHFVESAGRITKPSRTVNAKPAHAIAACRNFPATSR